MRRRQLLGVVGTGIASAVAGCSLSGVSGVSENAHPLSGTTTVRIDDISDAGQDTEAIAREALQFWERRDEGTLDFSVSFDLVEEDPDVILAFADESVGCEDVDAHPDEVLGCAPLLQRDHSLDPPVTARVVVGERPRGLIEITAKHELGHLLGRAHDDTPVEIMSNDPADRIPLYETRITIRDAIRAAQQRSNDAMDRYNEGVEAWNEEEFEAASESFAAAVEQFQTAGERVEEARRQAADLDAVADTAKPDTLTEQFDRLGRRMALGEQFTTTMRDAATTAADGDRTEAQQLAESAEETISDHEDTERPSMRAVAVALGLVQEFDRSG